MEGLNSKMKKHFKKDRSDRYLRQAIWTRFYSLDPNQSAEEREKRKTPSNDMENLYELAECVTAMFKTSAENCYQDENAGSLRSMLQKILGMEMKFFTQFGEVSDYKEIKHEIDRNNIPPIRVVQELVRKLEFTQGVLLLRLMHKNFEVKQVLDLRSFASECQKAADMISKKSTAITKIEARRSVQDVEVERELLCLRKGLAIQKNRVVDLNRFAGEMLAYNHREVKLIISVQGKLNEYWYSVEHLTRSKPVKKYPNYWDLVVTNSNNLSD